MTCFLLALALASTGQTGDTGVQDDPTPETADTASAADTGAASDAGTASTETAATTDAAPVTAAGLAGETGGLGCRSAGRGPVRLGALLGLVVLLRRRQGSSEPRGLQPGSDGAR